MKTDVMGVGVPAAGTGAAADAPGIPPRAADQGDQRPLLAALGDSVSVGVGDLGENAGWVAHLAALMHAELINVSSNGARARDLATAQRGVLRDRRPRLVSVFVGGNDVLRGDFDAEEVRVSVASVVAEALGGGAHVILVAPPRIGPALPMPRAVRQVLGRRMEQVRGAVHDVALSSGDADGRLLFVDLEVVRSTAGDRAFHIDRIHPSPLGHRIIAGMVAGRLAEEGWPAPGRTSEVPPPPALVARIAWLIVKGVPWLAKRSRDLLPELVMTVVQEQRRNRRLSRSGAGDPAMVSGRIAAGRVDCQLSSDGAGHAGRIAAGRVDAVQIDDAQALSEPPD